MLLFLIVFLLTLVYLSNIGDGKISVCIENKKCFEVEISDSQVERTMGLSGYKSLQVDSGMFFVFPEEINVGFWMKNMNFPLDIIWINKDYEIIGFEESVEPCESYCKVYYPGEEILYVLEINSGLSGFYNFEIGDRVKV